MLTELQKKKLPNLFNLHDLDKNGVIEQADFEQFTQMVCGNQGIEIGSSEYTTLNERYMALWSGLSAMADTNQDNQVTLTEWYSFCDTMLSTEGMYEQVSTPLAGLIFDLVDHDNDGRISLDEYIAFVQTTGTEEAVATDVFSRLDHNQDGYLSTDEILMRLEEFFRSDDPAAPGNWFFGSFE
ncbi:MAG: EF-hand domain-containing protein [Chloroflexota bacterium]